MKKNIFSLFLFVIFFNAIAQTSPEDAISSQLAAQYFQEGEYDKAVSIYKESYRKNPTDTNYDLYFNTLLKLKQYDEAEKLVNNQIKTNPANYAFKVDYGKILQERGDVEKVKSWYDDLIKNMPKNEYAIGDLATNLYKASPDYAIKTYIAGRKLMNDETAFTYGLLRVYQLTNNKEKLIEEYLNVLATDQQALIPAKNVMARSFQENADYEMLAIAIRRRLQKNPQNLAYEQMLAWVYIQEKQFDMALKNTIALDKRLKEEGDRVWELVDLLISAKAYTTAIEGLQYLIGKGSENNYYVLARVELINTKNEQLLSGTYSKTQLLELEKDYIALLDDYGRGSNTSKAILQLANLQAFYINKPLEAQKLLENLLKVRDLPLKTIAETKLELGDVYIMADMEYDAALIYGQVTKEFSNEPQGQEAKYRWARLDYYRGEFQWSKSQLDVLKSSTSELIANDALNLVLLIEENTISEADTNALKSYARADFLIYKSQFDPAIAILDSINIKFPGNMLTDDIVMAKAKIYLKQNETQKAAEQLQKIIDNYKFDLWADDATFMLAELYETKLNDPEKAKTLYYKIIEDFPGSLYVIEARKRYLTLRGDKS